MFLLHTYTVNIWGSIMFAISFDLPPCLVCISIADIWLNTPETGHQLKLLDLPVFCPRIKLRLNIISKGSKLVLWLVFYPTDKGQNRQQWFLTGCRRILSYLCIKKNPEISQESKTQKLRKRANFQPQRILQAIFSFLNQICLQFAQGRAQDLKQVGCNLFSFGA